MQHTHYLFKSTQQHCGHYMGCKGHSYQMYSEVQTDVFYKDIGFFFFFSCLERTCTQIQCGLLTKERASQIGNCKMWTSFYVRHEMRNAVMSHRYVV